MQSSREMPTTNLKKDIATYTSPYRSFKVKVQQKYIKKGYFYFCFIICFLGCKISKIDKIGKK